MRCRSGAALALALVLFAAGGSAAATDVAATAATQFDFANGLYSRGHYASAIDAYTAFLDLAPDDARGEVAMFRLGESLYALERYAEAEQAYRTLVHRWPHGAKADAARLRTGQCGLARGRHAEAITDLEALLAGNLDATVRTAALYALGQAAYDSGDASKAIAVFTKLAAAPADSPLVPFADYYLGYLRWHTGDPAAAERHFAAFAAASKDPVLRGEALVRAGETALAVDRAADAATRLQEALQGTLAPDLLDTAIRTLAWAEYQQARYAEAIAVHDTWTGRVTSPEISTEVRYVAGEAAFQLGDYDRARRELTRVLAQAEGASVQPAARLRLAWTQFLQEDYPACAATADAGMAAGQTHGREELAYLAAAARFGAGQHDEAARGMRAFVKAYPQSPLVADAWYQLGASEQALGHLTAARDAFDEAVRAGDGKERGARARFRAGEARFGLKDFAGAAEQWTTLLGEQPDDPLAADALFRLGLAHYRLDQFEAMEADYTRFRERFATHGLVLDAAYWLGWAQQRQEKYAVAAQSFALVTGDRSAKYYADALGRQALCAYQSEQEAQAAVLYVRYLREIPDKPLPRDVLFWLGHFMRERGEWQTAKTVYERTMVQHPTDDVIEAARYEIGRCLQTGGKLPEALAAFDRVLQDFPAGSYQAKAQLGRGEVLQAQGRYADAAEALGLVAGLDEGFLAAEATLRMGQCFEAQDKLRDAADRYLFVTIVFDAPALAGEAYLSAGRCLEALGETEQARSTYAEFVKRYPDDPQVAAAQARLHALAPTPEPVPTPPAPEAETAS